MMYSCLVLRLQFYEHVVLRNLRPLLPVVKVAMTLLILFYMALLMVTRKLSKKRNHCAS